ncbi:TetR family transcriptional regulator [Microbacterium sp.]|uniref:TetR/AcrR family transcriptional regulator n=1 Tax=Microbacterium sp. TaxID=51671 RepID=UPI002810BEF8|nr:TetR family transcriptional regulator [Microbacterium sp.]
MASTPARPRVRKSPEARRSEILGAASAIALSEGLERITLRAVAERLGVRPGLVTHYFPAAEALVVEAFVTAASEQRERLFRVNGSPLERIARFVAHADGADALPLARLWLNARHLSRFIPGLAGALEEQEKLDEARLRQVIEAAIADGDVPARDAGDTAIRILMALDGKGAYANDRTPYTDEVYLHFVTDYAEWALGVPRGRLRDGGRRGPD